MPVVTSALTFNGYTFPAGFSVDGKDQDVQLDALKLLQTHGSIFTPPTFKPKVVKVSGHIGGYGAVDSLGVSIMDRDAAKAELNRLALAIGNGYGLLSIGNVSSPRTLRCQLQNMIVTPVPGMNQAAVAVSLAFVAPDPRWLGPWRTYTFISPDPGGTNPVPPLITYGNAWAFPVFTITGPVSYTAFGAAPIGVNSRYLRGGNIFSGAFTPAARNIASGQLFVIDSQPANRARAVTVNGVPDFTMLQSVLPGLVGFDQPDIFPVIYPTPSGVTGFEPYFGSPLGPTQSIAWQDAWWC